MGSLPDVKDILQGINAEADALQKRAISLARDKARVEALTVLMTNDSDHLEVYSKDRVIHVKYMYDRCGIRELSAKGSGNYLLDALEACALNLKQNIALLNPNQYLIARRHIQEFEEYFGVLS